MRAVVFALVVQHSSRAAVASGAVDGACGCHGSGKWVAVAVHRSSSSGKTMVVCAAPPNRAPQPTRGAYSPPLITGAAAARTLAGVIGRGNDKKLDRRRRRRRRRQAAGTARTTAGCFLERPHGGQPIQRACARRRPCPNRQLPRPSVGPPPCLYTPCLGHRRCESLHIGRSASHGAKIYFPPWPAQRRGSESD